MSNNIIEEFESMRYMAELRVYSKVSLQRKLTNEEYERMMELKTMMFGE